MKHIRKPHPQYFKLQISSSDSEFCVYDYYKIYGNFITPETSKLLIDSMTLIGSTPIEITKHIWFVQNDAEKFISVDKEELTEEEWNETYEKLYDNFREILKKKGNYLSVTENYRYYFKIKEIIGEKAKVDRINETTIEEMIIDISILSSRKYTEITKEEYENLAKTTIS